MTLSLIDEPYYVNLNKVTEFVRKRIADCSSNCFFLVLSKYLNDKGQSSFLKVATLERWCQNIIVKGSAQYQRLHNDNELRPLLFSNLLENLVKYFFSAKAYFYKTLNSDIKWTFALKALLFPSREEKDFKEKSPISIKALL